MFLLIFIKLEWCEEEEEEEEEEFIR